MTVMVSLGDVAEFIRGVTFKPDELVSFGEQNSVVCMRTKNVQKDLDESDLISIPRKLVKKDTKLLKEGDLLVSTANSFELVGKACWVPKLDYPTTAGGFISILRAEPNKIDQRYLYHWIKTDSTQHSLRYCGRKTTNISNMDFGQAKELKLPLPPLEEQKRIAAILDKADAIRRKRQQAIDLTDQLLRSVFLDMFGDPLVNDKLWNINDLNSICTKITDGTHDTPKREESGIPYITGKHIRPFKIDYDNCDYVSEEVHKEIYRRCNPENGDVLYTNIGVNLGTAALNTVNYEFSMKNVALLKPKKEMIIGDFLVHVLNEQRMKSEIKRIASLGGAQGFLSLKDIKNLKIFVPPIELQKKFVEIVSGIRDSNLKRIKSIKQTEDLFNALTQQAFRGELNKQTEAA